MDDYIPREAARNLMYQKQEALTEYDLDSIPAADVAPVRHGRWIPFEEYAKKIKAENIKHGGKGWVYCSECGQPARSFAGWAGCPNCLAKMDGGDTT